ncbi:uncharacterized protein LOC143908877 [Temnothorax americanus]|uniref:uncharacterized protein LOC143908877 n=1 Tax=Temnothorax americanus TaxID=1964332 RepID=UPI00406778B4
MNQLIEELRAEFEITVDRNPESFLGMEIRHSSGKLKLTQENYSTKVLEKYKMNKSKSVSTPLAKGEESVREPVKINYPYREAIGSLLYLSSKTRPDLAQAVRFGSRYLNGTRDQGISFSSETNGNEIIAYCDSDYAGDPDTRKSTTGCIIFYCGGPVSWCSRKQSIVATSSTEAKYIAAAECCKET